jgi:5-methyltetrahydrofolate--homocysteine methyltransferase
MQLTSAFQLVPEQSTAAIIVHHPAAKYYTVRELGDGKGASAAPLPRVEEVA